MYFCVRKFFKIEIIGIFRAKRKIYVIISQFPYSATACWFVIIHMVFVCISVFIEVFIYPIITFIHLFLLIHHILVYIFINSWLFHPIILHIISRHLFVFRCL